MKRFLHFDTRELVLAAVAGVASAAIGHVLGRSVRMFVPVPMVGSLLAAVPRSVILLVVQAHMKRFGALTLAGTAEALIALGLGGMFPVSVLAPLVSGLAADGIWSLLRFGTGGRFALVVSGGVLCGTRVLTAFLVLIAARMPVVTGPRFVMVLLGGIVVANVILGILSGLLAYIISRELKQAGTTR